MQHIDDYLATGKPVMGLRTSTHGFKGLKGKFAKYNEGYNGNEKEWKAGFGEAILGEHWVGHYGRNHKQSSRLLLEKDQIDASDPARRQRCPYPVWRLQRPPA